MWFGADGVDDGEGPGDKQHPCPLRSATSGVLASSWSGFIQPAAVTDKDLWQLVSSLRTQHGWSPGGLWIQT